MEIVKYDKVFDISHIPENYSRHIAFAGKSNVGKSSLLNALFNRKRLAPTSSKPGKTRGLNIYIAEKKYIICDLPGYGYAAFSKAQREQFLILSADYFRAFCDRLFLFILIDIRRDVSELDLSLLNYASRYNIPYGIVLTKTDKISSNKRSASISRIKSELKDADMDADCIFPVSVKSKAGMEELSGFMKNRLFQYS